MKVKRLRSTTADVVWLVAAGIATVLGIGVVCVGFGLNEGNPIVGFFVTVSGWLDFGTIKVLSGSRATAHEHMIDWAVAAVLWLIIGRVLERIIRP